MPEGLAFIPVIVGFALIAAAGARFGAGSPAALAGLFPTQGARDWPTGVQESDAPHFVFAHPPGLAAGSLGASDRPTDPLPFEIEELYAGPIR